MISKFLNVLLKVIFFAFFVLYMFFVTASAAYSLCDSALDQFWFVVASVYFVAVFGYYFFRHD